MKKVFSFFLVFVFILIAVPPVINAADSTSLGVGVISDIHYYPAELTGDYCPAFLEFSENDTRQIGQSVGLLNSTLYALEKHAEEKGLKYLLISGDLSRNGEYEAHRVLAQRLEQFESDTGIQVIVINGNHDINRSGAVTFENGVMEEARATTPQEWLYLYRNLGYDIAYHTYTPYTGQQAGMLSYSVKLDGGYRLIAMDMEEYSSDEGGYPYDLMQWVKNEMADAVSDGEKIIGMVHHSVAAHFDTQTTVMSSLMVENQLETSEAFADGGMRYVFTGHTHMSDIATAASDSGATITDIMTASLIGYPNTFREVVFDCANGAFTAQVSTLDPDCETPVTYLDTTYEKPYKNTFGFGQTFGHDGLAGYGTDEAYKAISEYISQAQDKGIVEILRENGIDLGDGAAAELAELVFERLEEIYLSDPQNLYDLIYKTLSTAASMQASEESCTKFIDTLGFGNTERGGNIEEFGMSLIVYLFGGDEDLSDDPFMADVLERFKSGELTDVLLRAISTVLIDDLFADDLPSFILQQDTAATKAQLLEAVDELMSGLLDETLYPYLSELITDPNFSQSEYVGDVLCAYAAQSGLSDYLAVLVESLITDFNPGLKQDSEAFLSYTDPVSVYATALNGRLPSAVTVLEGSSDTEKTITWLTKYSVSGTDIEILPCDDTPFTGVPSGNICNQYAQPVINSYYAITLPPDIGLFEYESSQSEHGLTVYGLESDTVYRFRVGDASKGWWSEEFYLDTSSGGGDFELPYLSVIMEFLNSFTAILRALAELISIFG